MHWIIGIDGGGTKTVGCAADSTGRIMGRVEKGPSNYHTAGLGNFQKVIRTLVDELAVLCKVSTADLQVISLGLAGVDRMHDQKIIMGSLAELGLACQFLVHNDAKAALVAGLDKAEGIVLIAGTGSIAYGINRQGESIRAGGWGHLVSDEGSGYAIGRQALVRGMKAVEQRDRPTDLVRMIIEYLGLQNLDQLIGWINNQATTKAEVAGLAQVVVTAAQAGDTVATEILLQAGDELASLVESVMTRGFKTDEVVPLCLYGGIANNIQLIRTRIEEKLAGKAKLVSVMREPVEGAVKIGLDWLTAKEQGICV